MPLRGVDILRNKKYSKSTAFTKEERQELGLRGLLPYSSISQKVQAMRVMENLRKKTANIEKYIFMSALQDRNERLYHYVIMNNLEEILPIIYTPTVGEVCLRFSHIYRIDKGFYITPDDKGEIDQLLDNWPEKDIRVIVVTDGSRILGLGDLGVNGIGIPIGKLTLYTAGAGIDPSSCLPVILDLGTNNEELLKDLLYLGYPSKRIAEDLYYEILDEFITSVQIKYPKALIQFEDFVTPRALKILERYKEKVLCFNDDIQGTASVALAGVLASTKISNVAFKDSVMMFLGAGSAATGIADLMVKALVEEGLRHEEALKRLWFVDIDGLVVKERNNLLPHNLPYAHQHPSMNFIDAINDIKPNILIGASGAGGAFTKEVIEAMCTHNSRPVIFALSNPTSNSECTAEQAYTWSDGKAIFASGSPFEKVNYNDIEYTPGQGNNVYIFPGIGLGAIACEAKFLPDEVFLEAAKELASQVSQDNLLNGTVYPKMTDLKNISHSIATRVAEIIYAKGLAKYPKPENLSEHIRKMMYDPRY
jgi:malate dehydrogenase (oxaloacetate-decarboxylating)(NADP+)